MSFVIAMKPKSDNVPDLSQRVSQLIEKEFAPADQRLARELVREFHWKWEPLVDERIHLDILEVCSGNIERVRELVKLAKQDWRDLIMATEYEVRDGKTVPTERLAIRLAEVDAAQKRRQETQ